MNQAFYVINLKVLEVSSNVPDTVINIQISNKISFSVCFEETADVASAAPKRLIESARTPLSCLVSVLDAQE